MPGSWSNGPAPAMTLEAISSKSTWRCLPLSPGRSFPVATTTAGRTETAKQGDETCAFPSQVHHGPRGGPTMFARLIRTTDDAVALVLRLALGIVMFPH